MKRKIKKFNNKQEFLENLINNCLKVSDEEFEDIVYEDKIEFQDLSLEKKLDIIIRIAIEKNTIKIDVDCENYGLTNLNQTAQYGQYLLEYKTTEEQILEHCVYDANSLYFITGYMGGDWEFPVNFIVYIDQNNKNNLYIPTEGNTFNKLTKTAYGNEDDNDKHYDKHLNLLPQYAFNKDLFLKDILNRFEVVES